MTLTYKVSAVSFTLTKRYRPVRAECQKLDHLYIVLCRIVNVFVKTFGAAFILKVLFVRIRKKNI